MNEMEKSLEMSGLAMVEQAKELQITTHEDYENAGKILVEIKNRVKKVKDYWKDKKALAAAAHKAVCDSEKQMLNPLADAENIIKKSMVLYQQAVEKARREAEEAARKRQQEEADRLLQEAIKAQESGDDQSAAINVAMAQMVDEMNPSAEVEKPTADGTSVRKTWKARVIDEKVVPAYFNGVEIRAINMSALNNLAKMSSGSMEIPGVEFYQESTLVVRT